jgi:predicted alpha-1,6-mannanase (GH76 family)
MRGRTIMTARLAALALIVVVAACGARKVTPPAPPPGAQARPDLAAPEADAGVPVDAAASDGAAADLAHAGDDAGSGPVVDPGPGGDFRGYADGAAAALQQLYDPATGLFPSTGWWNAANALTALIDYSLATQSTAYVGDIVNTFDKNKASNFLNDYYDDEGWWALAWIRAYDLTRQTQYLDAAKTIFSDMSGGWDSTCNGGIWWSKAKTYKNAIANELFLEVAVRLHQRSPGDGGAGSFLEWAQREWQWFNKSGMINGEDLVNDGLTSGCVNNGQTAWTYNQGVLIGGLVDLANVSGDNSLVARASAIAQASMHQLVDGNGVLREPCEPSCGGDGPQFKGVLMRHLGELEARTGDATLRVFLARNADWIWNANRNAQNQLGLGWSGPFDSADDWRAASALDALNAAVPFSAPQKNLALFMSATASASCAADQTADRAVDGALTTKWCAGASSGGYWLTIDLGAAQPVGRVILRHASAGGENVAWNTRDFALALIDGAGTATTVATVTGNTAGVTIHRFAAATAQKVRLTITAPQTDPMTVAARLYEMEVYSR